LGASLRRLGQGGHGNSEGTQSEEHEEQDENTLGEVHLGRLELKFMISE